MQSYGSDVGGFAGDFPTPELFVRWVQLGVTHSRFCIHSNDKTPSGDKKLNNPWMVGYLLPLVDLVDGLAVPRGLACCQEGDQVAIRASPLLASVFCLFGFFPDADVNLRSRSNSLMWNSHLHAIPTTLPLFFGEFASDPTLYTPKLLEGFDAWIGPGQLLSAPALYEGMFSREVYFPKSSPNDGSLYFDLHEPYGRHQAGTWTTIATPWEHAGLFAREGAVIPIGKDCATVTQTSGPARTNIDGVDTVLESDGGVVGLDDWRGVRIFPGTDGRKHKSTWIEDDGVLAEPERTMIEVTYSSKSEEVVVSCMFVESGYVPLWGRELHVVLPVGDGRVVKGVKEGTVWGVKEVEVERREWRGREVWVVQVGG